MPSSRLISVITPVFNEEENIIPFYEAVKAVTDELNGFQWEFIFADDGSTDRTFEQIRLLREKDPRIFALQLSRNFGSYSALRAGFDYARGEAVITIAVDLQDSPQLFKPFVSQWQEGYHIVWAVRTHRADNWLKKTLATLFYRLAGQVALPQLPPGGMDYGLFDRKVIDAFRRINDQNNITFMTIYWMGFKQAWVPYRRGPRKRGASKWPLGKRLKSALDVLTSFSYLPIRLASYLGLAVSFLSLLGAGVIVVNKFILGIGGWGWPSIMVAMLLLGGVQLIMLGILGEYLWRVSNVVRGQPPYILMNRIGFSDKDLVGKVG